MLGALHLISVTCRVDVCFTPKADMCGATNDVGYGTDIQPQ
jgi:hypothetical protein